MDQIQSERRKRCSIKWYVRRVFIMNVCDELIPEWLTFVVSQFNGDRCRVRSLRSRAPLVTARCRDTVSFLELAFHSVIGKVACQGDATPCVLRPCLLRPFVWLSVVSDFPIYWLCPKLRTGLPYQIRHWGFGEDRKLHQVQRRVESHNSRTGKCLNCTSWDRYPEPFNANLAWSMNMCLRLDEEQKQRIKARFEAVWAPKQRRDWCVARKRAEQCDLLLHDFLDQDAAINWANKPSPTCNGLFYFGRLLIGGSWFKKRQNNRHQC